MSYSVIREIFQEMCEIEIATLKNDHLTVDEATSLYNHLITLHVKFIETQVRLIKSCDCEDEYHFPDIFDSIQQKATLLRSTLKKIINNDDESKSTAISQSNQPIISDSCDSFSRKQKMFIKMIESLEWNDDLIANEAWILLDHLNTTYKLFVDNQLNMAFCIKDDSDFEQQLEKSSEIQEKVIQLQKKLKKIISESNPFGPSSSTPQSVNNSDIKADHSKHEVNQLDMSFCIKDDSDLEKLEKSSNIQKKVIQLQKELRKIIASDNVSGTLSSTPQSSNKSDPKADHSKLHDVKSCFKTVGEYFGVAIGIFILAGLVSFCIESIRLFLYK